jgi:hypothetical protein
MTWRLRVYIAESQHMFRLVNEFHRDLAGGELAEKAIRIIHHVTRLC